MMSVLARGRLTRAYCQMFGDDESDTESIPSEKEHKKKTAVPRHASREAFKKGVVRPISLSLDTRGCASPPPCSALLLGTLALTLICLCYTPACSALLLTVSVRRQRR